MLDTGSKTETEDEEAGSLRASRLECIKKGDLNWIGKGFLDVIKNDCENSTQPRNGKKGLAQ